MIRAFEARFGKEETHDVVRDVVESLARQSGRDFCEASASEDSIDRARELVPAFSADQALEVEVVQDDEDHYGFNVTRCRFAEFYREMGAADLGALLSCSRDFALAEALGDDVTLERNQTLLSGCDHCDFRFRREPEPKDPKAAPSGNAGA